MNPDTLKRFGLAALLFSAASLASDQARSSLTGRLPSWLAESGTPSAAVGVVRGGQVAWTMVAGEREPGQPAGADTLFNVASMTKPITAETALRLASAGKIDLDASMSEHWLDPDLENDPHREELTPRLCLSHQCGFPNWRYETDDRLAIQWPPGSRVGYSGEGYDYVARFLEHRLGRPFPELVAEQVFAPADMRATAFTGMPWFDGRVARPLGPEGAWGEPAVRTRWSAADDLHTTIGDYTAFVAAVLRGDGLSEPLARARWMIDHDMAAMVCAPGRLAGEDCPRRMGFALGWARFETPDDVVFFHGGGDWGERSFAFLVPSRELGVVVLTNGANGMQVVRSVAGELYDNPAFLAFLSMQARH